MVEEVNQQIDYETNGELSAKIVSWANSQVLQNQSYPVLKILYLLELFNVVTRKFKGIISLWIV